MADTVVPAAVTMTLVVLETDPLVAVTVTVPATLSLIVAVKTPDDEVVPESGERLAVALLVVSAIVAPETAAPVLS